MSTKGAPPHANGEVKEEAERPANYLAKNHLHFDFYEEGKGGKQWRLNLAKAHKRGAVQPKLPSRPWPHPGYMALEKSESLKPAFLLG